MFNGVGFSATEEQQVVDMVNNGDLNRMAAEAGLNASQTSLWLLQNRPNPSVFRFGSVARCPANGDSSQQHPGVNQSTQTQIDDAEILASNGSEASNIVAARDARADGRFTNMSQLTAVSGMDSYVVTALRDEFGNHLQHLPELKCCGYGRRGNPGGCGTR